MVWKKIARLALLSLLLGLALLSCGKGPGPLTFSLIAGHGEQTVAVEDFMPQSITIRAGDTMTWTVKSEEPHTVTFLSGAEKPPEAIPDPENPQQLLGNPQVFFPVGGKTYSGSGYFNSGFLLGAQSYSLAFDKEGDYEYICILHPSMKGSVTVKKAGVRVAVSQAEIDKQMEMEMMLHEEDAKKARAANLAPQKALGPGGATEWKVKAGIEAKSGHTVIDLMEFLPDKLTIKEGDTVVFEVMHGAPHTVSFMAGEKPLDFMLQEPQPQGPPKLVMNPKALIPAAVGRPYDGAGFWNSGALNLGPQAPKVVSVTFSRAGTYTYLCILHANQGMEGTIVVEKR